MKHGDREEGKFLAQEAEQLDPSAADEVLKKSDTSASAAKSTETQSGKTASAGKSSSKQGSR